MYSKQITKNGIFVLVPNGVTQALGNKQKTSSTNCDVS